MMTETASNGKRKLGRWQMNLSTFMAASIFLGLMMAWWADHYRLRREMQELIDFRSKHSNSTNLVNRLKKEVRFAGQIGGPSYWRDREVLGELTDAGATLTAGPLSISLPDKTTDQTLRRLKDLTKVHKLELSGPNVTDDDIDSILDLRLEVLRLIRTRLTGAGMRKLASIATLKCLDLQNDRPDDSVIEGIASLRHLEELQLGNSRITDAGMKHLQGLTSLRVLSLAGTRVTDAGLEHLRELTSLQVLRLYGAQVTPEGVARLREALPDCAIHY